MQALTRDGAGLGVDTVHWSARLATLQSLLTALESSRSDPAVRLLLSRLSQLLAQVERGALALSVHTPSSLYVCMYVCMYVCILQSLLLVCNQHVIGSL